MKHNTHTDPSPSLAQDPGTVSRKRATGTLAAGRPRLVSRMCVVIGGRAGAEAAMGGAAGVKWFWMDDNRVVI